MKIDTSNIVLNESNAISTNILFLGAGVECFIDGDYAVKARFINPANSIPMIYLNMSPNIEELMNKVMKYKDYPEFSGKIYRLNECKAIPVIYNGKEDVKDWV